MLPYFTMRITDEQRLENLKLRRQKLEKDLATRRDKINDNLRSVRKRLSDRQRKRDTQRLIVKGRFLDHILKRLASNPPDCSADSPQFRAWLDAAFNAFVTRADHRALFDLPPLDKPGKPSTPSPAGPAPTASRDNPIPGWKPKRHEGAWAAIYRGDTSTLPDELVGGRIVVKPHSDPPWIATVLEVLKRTDRLILVRRTNPPTS